MWTRFVQSKRLPTDESLSGPEHIQKCPDVDFSALTDMYISLIKMVFDHHQKKEIIEKKFNPGTCDHKTDIFMCHNVRLDFC